MRTVPSEPWPPRRSKGFPSFAGGTAPLKRSGPSNRGGPSWSSTSSSAIATSGSLPTRIFFALGPTKTHSRSTVRVGKSAVERDSIRRRRLRRHPVDFPAKRRRLFQSGTVHPVSSETGGARVIRAVSDAEAWLGGGQTILHLTDGAVEASELPRRITPDICEGPGTVRGIAPAPDGALWIGAGRSGALRLTPCRFYVYPGENVGSEPCSMASRVRTGAGGSACLFFESTGKIVFLGPGTF
jgi:hypothetical protein